MPFDNNHYPAARRPNSGDRGKGLASSHRLANDVDRGYRLSPRLGNQLGGFAVSVTSCTTEGEYLAGSIQNPVSVDSVRDDGNHRSGQMTANQAAFALHLVAEHTAR